MNSLYRGLVAVYDVAVLLIVSGYLVRQSVACRGATAENVEAKCLTVAEWCLALSFLAGHVVVGLMLFCGRGGKGLAGVTERRMGLICSMLMACALGYVAFFAGLHLVASLEQNAPRILRELDGALPSPSTCAGEGGHATEYGEAEQGELQQLFAEMNGEAKAGQGCKAGGSGEMLSLWQVWLISTRTLMAIVKVLLTAPDEPHANNSLSAAALRALREEGTFYKLCSPSFFALAVFGALLQLFIIARLNVDPPEPGRSSAASQPSTAAVAAAPSSEARGNGEARCVAVSAKKTA